MAGAAAQPVFPIRENPLARIRCPIQFFVRRGRDFLRCSPAYQIDRSDAPNNLLSSSSLRRSAYFLKRHRHCCGIEQSGNGSFGASTARLLVSFSDLTAEQQLLAVIIATAGYSFMSAL